MDISFVVCIMCVERKVIIITQRKINTNLIFGGSIQNVRDTDRNILQNAIDVEVLINAEDFNNHKSEVYENLLRLFTEILEEVQLTKVSINTQDNSN